MATRRALRKTVKRKRARKVAPRHPDAARTQRVGLLYGLSGLFTLVIGGLLLARPQPLAGSDRSAGPVLAATDAPANRPPVVAPDDTRHGRS